MITLIGDSIFDNGPYVKRGHSVSEILRKRGLNTTLLAIDGDVTTGVERQIKGKYIIFDDVFVSVGGNDALGKLGFVYSHTATSLMGALQDLNTLREGFRADYSAMMDAVLAKVSSATFCTIYNKVPDLGEPEQCALALFNEIITEEVNKREMTLIDLRVICNEKSDYALCSPIEPSETGGEKIADAIIERLKS